MNRKFMALNLALLVLAASLGWHMRRRWLDSKEHERAALQRAAQPRPILPPPPAAQMKPVTSIEYQDVAQRTLFSQDRNPNVVLPPPPPPKPEPPLPPLPSYHGQMAIGDPVVILSTASNSAQKRYHAGEEIGPFKLVGFDHEKITFDWNGKTVERKLEELTSKEAPPPQQVANTAAPPPPAQAAGSLASAPAANSGPALGLEQASGMRGCAPGDTSPAGTVLDGFKKVTNQTLMGKSCWWEPVNK